MRDFDVTLAGSGTAFHLAYLEAQRRDPATPLFPSVRAFPGGAAPKPATLHEAMKRELGGAGVTIEGVTQPTLAAAEIETMIEEGVATGGMAAKLRAAAQALGAGVRAVRIGDLEMFVHATAGTRLLAAPPATAVQPA